MTINRIVIALSVTLITFVGSANQATNAQPKQHYPKLIRAEMPLYPSIARTANHRGTVEIEVTVEFGSVVDVQVKSSSSPLLTKPTIENVKTWQFVSEDRVTFLVKYVYEIKGKETLTPENPKIELDLPRFVRIVVRPFRPTRT